MQNQAATKRGHPITAQMLRLTCILGGTGFVPSTFAKCRGFAIASYLILLVASAHLRARGSLRAKSTLFLHPSLVTGAKRPLPLLPAPYCLLPSFEPEAHLGRSQPYSFIRHSSQARSARCRYCLPPIACLLPSFEPEAHLRRSPLYSFIRHSSQARSARCRFCLPPIAYCLLSSQRLT